MGYKPKFKKHLVDGQVAFFDEVGGLNTLMFNNYEIMEGISGPYGLLNLALPEIFSKGGLDPKEISRAQDRAMAVNLKGGIDFNPNKMRLQIQNGGEAVKFHIDPAMLQQLQNASGFVPVIITIQPVNIREFLQI